jgi:hypothetical protein
MEGSPYGRGAFMLSRINGSETRGRGRLMERKGENMKRTLRPLAALAMVGMVSAGCSNAPAGAGTSSGNNAAATHQEAVKFAECMRNHGVGAFPDPSASGAFTIDGVLNGSSLDPNSAAWKQAIGVCTNLEPPGFTGGRVTSQQRTARLKFAQCMRDNGVKDFPDPTDTGPLINVNGAHSIPGFQAAVDKCRDLLAGAGGGQ